MNENINLIEILKDCPKGAILYSPIFGYVEFDSICDNSIIVVPNYYDNEYFTKEGKYCDMPDTECLLFPSKENRDWNTFKVKNPKFDPKTLQPFDKVLVKAGDACKWKCALFSHIDNHGEYCCCGYKLTYEYCIPYNDETKHLVGTTEEAPEYYRYWEK